NHEIVTHQSAACFHFTFDGIDRIDKSFHPSCTFWYDLFRLFLRGLQVHFSTSDQWPARLEKMIITRLYDEHFIFQIFLFAQYAACGRNAARTAAQNNQAKLCLHLYTSILSSMRFSYF